MSEADIRLRVRRLDAGVELPAYAYEGDAGLDLRSAEDVTLEPGERRLVSTGLAVAIPDGYAGFVMPRSGLALREGLSMANTPGLIDAHYRGELKICAVNLDPKRPIRIERGERVAQLVILKVPRVELVEVSALDETDRGTGGFGSSGVD
jgi:dUTP pyrophosphatase